MEAIKRRLRGTWLHRLAVLLTGGSWNAANTAYDRDTLEVMRRVLRPGAVGVDVGAHDGQFLAPMLRLAPGARHHAFEALPAFAARLRERFPSVEVHEVALGDHEGEAEFQHVENDPGYSGLRRRVYDRPDPKIVPIRVRVTTLDASLPPDSPVAFVKVDVEGGEYDVLRGALATVKRCRPVIVFEAGRKSTGQYGVTPAMLWELVTRELDCDLTTMARWLAGRAPYTQAEFEHNWESGPEYYFLAAAKRVS